MSAAVSVTTPARPLNEFTPPEVAIAVATNAVVAMDVSLSPGLGVGAVGFPENAGDASNAPPTALTSLARNVIAPVLPLNDDTPPGAAARAACTNAVVANCVVLVPCVAVGADGTPVKVGPANKAPPTAVKSALVKVTAPVRVFHELTPDTTPVSAACTNAVVASCVLLVPAVAVGAVGTPM